ncbi:MAG: phospholipase D-like domain-containing protein, partial [Acidobacteriota bacterium]
MSVRNVNIGSGERIESLLREIEQTKPAPSASTALENYQPLSDTGREERLAQQFLRGRLSVGNALIQRQLQKVLGEKRATQDSQQKLPDSITNITAVAKLTDGQRREETEKSLSTIRQIIASTNDNDRQQACQVLNRISSVIAENLDLTKIESILDKFNEIVRLLMNLGKDILPPTPTPSNSVSTNPTTWSPAHTQLRELGFSLTALRKITNTAAARLVELDQSLLQETAQQNLNFEQAFAKKIESLPITAFEKLKTLASSEQKRLTALPLEQMVEELTRTTPLPSPSGDATAARTQLRQIGFSLTTIRKISDTAAVRLVELDETILRDVAKRNLNFEQAFAKKIESLPTTAFDRLKSLDRAEQKRITDLPLEQMLEELKPPKPTEDINLYPMPEATPAPIVNAIKNAQKSVDVSIYLFTSPSVTGALKEAAARGVRVRVMLEPEVVGQKDANKEVAESLREAGIAVQDTPPEFSQGNKVDHAKFMIVDNKKLLFGTGNLVRSGLGEEGALSFNRDFWVEDTRAEVVNEARTLYEADWQQQSTSGIEFKHLVVTPDNGNQR